MENNELIRKEFEEYIKSCSSSIKKDLYNRDVYMLFHVEFMWKGWHACSKHYEAKIAELKAQIPQWLPISDLPNNRQMLAWLGVESLDELQDAKNYAFSGLHLKQWFRCYASLNEKLKEMEMKNERTNAE